jgi:hypothetical protein
VAGGSFTPLSMESYGRLGRPAMQLLQTLAAAAASSATAGSDVTTSSFVTGALRELGVALVKGNEVVYREALHVYATAGGTLRYGDPWQSASLNRKVQDPSGNLLDVAIPPLLAQRDPNSVTLTFSPCTG